MARIALEPLRKTLSPSRFDRLLHSVVTVFGVEAMITTRDTCELDPEAATEVMRWAARALVRAAIAEA
ncbi:hypothetical protein ACQP0C_25535 [Nocardia sp. CA-129566]|uniref:hypothetical protein n=1 Tax=Nocardia sp. CA-129566 TaxID=3239976 RepID=UPI003D959984